MGGAFGGIFLGNQLWVDGRRREKRSRRCVSAFGEFSGNKRGRMRGAFPVQNAKYWFTIFMAQ